MQFGALLAFDGRVRSLAGLHVLCPDAMFASAVFPGVAAVGFPVRACCGEQAGAAGRRIGVWDRGLGWMTQPDKI